MKVLRFLLNIVLLFIFAALALMLWPKGSLEDQMEKRHVPAVGYALINKGTIQTLTVIGELEQGVPAPEDAIFNVASVTKPVFALVVLKLVDAGFLDLDEPLYPYWIDPDLETDPRHRKLTARLVLSHQTGFPNWRWNLPSQKLAFMDDPGNSYGYSGEGFEYLKKAIEQKLGKSLVHLADSLLFKPLDMKDTRFIWDEDMDESRFAKWHDATGSQYEYVKREHPSAADDLMTTLADYSKFIFHIIHDKGGLSDSLFAEMVRDQVEESPRRGYGLGWELAKNMNGGQYALVHGGSDMGVRTRVVIMPQSQQAFWVFTNGDNGQRIIDRLMVDQFAPGGEVLSKIYAPVLWRLIDLPFG